MARWNGLEAKAEQGRIDAIERRNNGGGGTVRLYATTRALYAAQGNPEQASQTWGELVRDTRADLGRSHSDSLAAYRAECIGDDQDTWSDLLAA